MHCSEVPNKSDQHWICYYCFNPGMYNIIAANSIFMMLNVIQDKDKATKTKQMKVDMIHFLILYLSGDKNKKILGLLLT